MAEIESTRAHGTAEEEPLLGIRGDASLPAGKPLYNNLILGTGVVAQAGVWVIAAIVWGAVFSNNLMLFSGHPLANSAALLLYVQGILILQPTHTAKQKVTGTYVHSAFNVVAFSAAIVGLVIIEVNKFGHGGTHFESPHAILGLVTYIFLVLQALVGLTQFYLPAIYGGVDNAKALYKYHRVAGYITLLLMLATVCAATKTTFNIGVLKMQLWAVTVASVLVVIGVFARIRLSKFGWLAGK